MLYLYFEGSNQCIFRVHDHVICFAMKIETDSELQLHFSIPRLLALGSNPLYAWFYLEFTSLADVHAVVLRANIRSIFAAMMKSFSCSPLIFLVCRETVALPQPKQTFG